VQANVGNYGYEQKIGSESVKICGKNSIIIIPLSLEGEGRGEGDTGSKKGDGPCRN